MFCIQKLTSCSRWKSNSMPCPSGSALAEHEALRALGVVVGNLDREDMHAGLAGDLERLLSGCQCQAGSGKYPEENKSNPAKARMRSPLRGLGPGGNR